VLDRTTGMGSISFHVHGEWARNAEIALNVAVYVSSAFANNPAAEAAISNMQAIFTEEVTVSFAADWLTRTVDAGYLPGSVLCPQSSPIKDLIQNVTGPWSAPHILDGIALHHTPLLFRPHHH
jgi:hypothetical protein